MWSKGETVVYIDGHPGGPPSPIRVGQRVIIDGTAEPGWSCITHEEAQCVYIVDYPLHVFCAYCFRKPLDFKKLCNVDESTKIKEPA
jgi:hypothetical protein